MNGSVAFQSLLSSSKLNIKHSGTLRSDIQASTLPSENTSLLSPENNAGHNRLDDVYLRFSSTRKNIISVMVTGCTVIHCSSFMNQPCFPLIMSRFDDWDVYTFNTTYYQGTEFYRDGCQVIHFPRPSSFSQEGPFPVFSTAVSMSILAASLGALIAASYSTFVGCESRHD